MSTSPAVRVQSAIVHISDRSDGAPVCSEIDLDLDASGTLRDYFTGQVKNALDDETGAANFAATPPHDARDACRRILASEKELVPASQELAKLLYEAMGTHPSIAPGLLAVCTYSIDAGARHLALIKLDPGSGLVQKMARRNGKALVTFDVVSNVMPTARERLQKAALLPPVATQTYELLLLDRQTAEVSAAWWGQTFLNAKVIIDGKLGARVFRDVSYRVSDKLAKSGMITPAQADAMKVQTNDALHEKRVKRSAFVARLPIPKEAKEIVASELEKKFAGTPTVPIDVEFASDKLTKTQKYRGDYGFVLEVESDHFDTVVKEMEPFTASDGTPMTRLRLEVPNLQKVK